MADHEDIIEAARQLVEWVNAGRHGTRLAPHPLELAEARHGPTSPIRWPPLDWPTT